MIITRAELTAMSPEEYDAWQYTPEQVKLMPGPWYRNDDTLIAEDDLPRANDYMWTGHTAITVDDEDLADAVRANRGLIAAAIRNVEVDDDDGGKTLDRDLLRAELADTPQIKADIDKKRSDRDTVGEVIRDA